MRSADCAVARPLPDSSKTKVTARRASSRRTGDSLAPDRGGSAHPPDRFTVMSEPSMPDRVLVVMAHPDDVDFGAAGTVARWTDEGLDVVYCIVTDGEAGGSDRSVARADMAALRREEQTAAAKVLGV